MTDPTPDNPEGLSKSQLKKLAKKAAKQDKKAAHKEAAADGTGNKGGAADASAASKNNQKGGNNNNNKDVGGAAKKAAAAAPAVSAPKLFIANPKPNCAATLKAVYASQLFGVELTVAEKSMYPSSDVALLYGDECVVLGRGGNSMVRAIAMMSGSSIHVTADDWCEHERHHRSGKSELSTLESQLSSGSNIYVTGDSLSIADVCWTVTLDKHHASTESQVIKTYLSAHSASLEKAKKAVANYLPAPKADKNDPNLVKVLNAEFLEVVEGLFPTIALSTSQIISRCSNPKHGDFQCMAAMPVFAALKKSGSSDFKAPRDVAQKILDSLKDSKSFTNPSIQGPGFIAFTVSSDFLLPRMSTLRSTGKLPVPKVNSDTTCVVDFSSPNIAKEMHVGHLRSTIIGESVCRILESFGYKVHRVNHTGDWGTQFGMLISYLKENYDVTTGELPNITDLTEFYKAAKAKFDEDEDFKKTSQLAVVKLQGGDEESLKIWKLLCDVSRKEFEKVYKRLDITIEEFGESFYNDKIPAVVEEFEKAGMIEVQEGGAKCVFIKGGKIPLMLVKSDGGYGYDSTDMAALKYRLQTLNAQRIIAITDFSQGDHFDLCFKAGANIGWLDKGQKLQHIGFGTVQGEDGKRFKTRSGDTVRLVDLLDEAVSRMEASLKQRISEGKSSISEEDLHSTAEAIGYGAVKYFDLRRNPTSNYQFSYDAMLDTKGNTAVYLLYARARLESILEKAKAQHGVDVETLVKDESVKIILDHASERNLALQLNMFADTMELTLEDMFPYHICDYVYALANASSDFVTQCKVLGSDEMKSRLLLCYMTAKAMGDCFDLLGIRHIKRI